MLLIQTHPFSRTKSSIDLQNAKMSTTSLVLSGIAAEPLETGRGPPTPPERAETVEKSEFFEKASTPPSSQGAVDGAHNGNHGSPSPSSTPPYPQKSIVLPKINTNPLNPLYPPSLQNLLLLPTLGPRKGLFGLPDGCVVTLRNLPSDVTAREASLIFALSDASCELAYEGGVPKVVARFSSAQEAAKVVLILDGKVLFPGHPAVRAETDSIPSLPKRHASASAAQRSRFLFDPLSLPMEMTTPTTANAGKLLIMMDHQADQREYEQLVRGWNDVLLPGGNWDRRGFFRMNGKNKSGLSMGMGLGQSMGQGMGQSISQGMNSSLGINNGLTSIKTSMNGINLGMSTNNSPLTTQPLSQTLSQPISQPISQLPITNPSTPTANVDLSLLARVPLPLNPADQNPPCNTLYVGNLPPDATEAELRALFAPQAGFRRLSFKTKAPSASTGSHAHGPMCFVEFEDVGYATRALAELYGSQLPRPGGMSNKGGIRLSFLKNPLGVRGPGQRRGSLNYGWYN